MRGAFLYSVLIAAVIAVAVLCAASLSFAAEPKKSPSIKSETTPVSGWTKRCEKDNKYCEIYQRIRTKETGQRLIELALGYKKEDTSKVNLVAILPLGVKLEPGVVLKLTGLDQFKLPFKSCDQNGCTAAAVLPDSIFTALKKQNDFGVFVIDAVGKTVHIRITLAGFKQALETLSKK
jgi:invasion protein IalB